MEISIDSNHVKPNPPYGEVKHYNLRKNKSLHSKLSKIDAPPYIDVSYKDSGKCAILNFSNSVQYTILLNKFRHSNPCVDSFDQNNICVETKCQYAVPKVTLHWYVTCDRVMVQGNPSNVINWTKGFFSSLANNSQEEKISIETQCNFPIPKMSPLPLRSICNESVICNLKQQMHSINNPQMSILHDKINNLEKIVENQNKLIQELCKSRCLCKSNVSNKSSQTINASTTKSISKEASTQTSNLIANKSTNSIIPHTSSLDESNGWETVHRRKANTAKSQRLSAPPTEKVSKSPKNPVNRPSLSYAGVLKASTPPMTPNVQDKSNMSPKSCDNFKHFIIGDQFTDGINNSKMKSSEQEIVSVFSYENIRMNTIESRIKTFKPDPLVKKITIHAGFYDSSCGLLFDKLNLTSIVHSIRTSFCNVEEIAFSSIIPPAGRGSCKDFV